jgi:DNA-binding response OmpR family regulator
LTEEKSVLAYKPTWAERTRHYGEVVRDVPTDWLLRELQRRDDDLATRTPAVDPIVRAGPLTFDRAQRLATVRGATKRVTRREAEILTALAKRYPQPITSAALSLMIWPNDERANAQQSVRLTVHYLRKKFPDLIQTVPDGIGYLLGGSAS